MTAMTVVPNRRSVKFSSCALIHASSANTPPGISGFMIRSKAECPDRRKIPKKKPRVGDGAFSSWPVASRNCRHHHECCGLLIRDARNGSFGAETRTLTFDVISFALATQATERELFLRVESQVTTTRPLWTDPHGPQSSPETGAFGFRSAALGGRSLRKSSNSRREAAFTDIMSDALDYFRAYAVRALCKARSMPWGGMKRLQSVAGRIYNLLKKDAAYGPNIQHLDDFRAAQKLESSLDRRRSNGLGRLAPAAAQGVDREVR